MPPWMRGGGKGWVTAEYSLLPGSRPSGSPRGRKGPSIRPHPGDPAPDRQIVRAVTDLRAMGEMQITVDCDVLQADGGTRTASICGAYVALHDCFSG